VPRRRLGHRKVLGERRHSGHDAAGRIAHERPAVEDQLVVAPDRVYVRDRAPEGARRVRHQRLADARLAVIPGAGRQVDHEVALLRRQLPHRIQPVVQAPGADHGVGPDVLANRDANPRAGVGDDGGLGRGLEVAVLVEDVVRWQQALAREPGDTSPVAERALLKNDRPVPLRFDSTVPTSAGTSPMAAARTARDSSTSGTKRRLNKRSRGG